MLQTSVKETLKTSLSQPPGVKQQKRRRSHHKRTFTGTGLSDLQDLGNIQQMMNELAKKKESLKQIEQDTSNENLTSPSLSELSSQSQSKLKDLREQIQDLAEQQYELIDDLESRNIRMLTMESPSLCDSIQIDKDNKIHELEANEKRQMIKDFGRESLIIDGEIWWEPHEDKLAECTFQRLHSKLTAQVQSQFNQLSFSECNTVVILILRSMHRTPNSGTLLFAVRQHFSLNDPVPKTSDPSPLPPAEQEQDQEQEQEQEQENSPSFSYVQVQNSQSDALERSSKSQGSQEIKEQEQQANGFNSVVGSSEFKRRSSLRHFQAKALGITKVNLHQDGIDIRLRTGRTTKFVINEKTSHP